MRPMDADHEDGCQPREVLSMLPDPTLHPDKSNHSGLYLGTETNTPWMQTKYDRKNLGILCFAIKDRKTVDVVGDK